MIKHSHARNMAEAQWGNGGTTSYKTSRLGAFFFGCSSHGGFIIDSRALSEEEIAGMSQFIEPDKTSEIVDQSGKIRRFFNPYCMKRRTVTSYGGWKSQEVSIFTAEEDCVWCIPVLYAGIKIDGFTDENALECFKRWMKPSAHQILEVEALIAKRASKAGKSGLA